VSDILRVDILAREIFGRAAIAAGMSDRDEALLVCRDLIEIEGAYRLALRCGDEARSTTPASAEKPRRMPTQYAGTCRACGARHAVGDPVWWASGVRGVLCDQCGRARS
jgi:hypothetical protein